MLRLVGGRRGSQGFVRLREVRRCGGYQWHEFVQQCCQGAWLHAGFRGPEGDEIAARAEFAERLGGVIFVAEQLSSFVNILESAIRIHKQMSVSANGSELPKQKPNKNWRE